ncbi:DUF4870 family protein [Parasphingorhabdus halotolerans]|uniref:DUF4870 domain-containing protein n=1 Tax=Parasphingorhabdus halotolerans TaxID=2725558 RepID=A0A6H2DPM1_9SPHN|nr:DUF4870 domain-containing protein [Parasphingorhabdus halotolerans]QJB69616.1 DUF4870 domain-containing protein [Parasphingorhabdus halotolerans]
MVEQTPQPASGGFDFNKSTIISLLYIAGFVVGITGIVAFILALIWKDEVAGTWEESHLQYHVMTFIVSLIAGIIGFLLIILGIGILILLAVGLWVLVRSIIALLKAQKHEPMPDPKTLLF